MLAMIPSNSNFPFVYNSSFDLNIKPKGAGVGAEEMHTRFQGRTGWIPAPKLRVLSSPCSMGDP